MARWVQQTRSAANSDKRKNLYKGKAVTGAATGGRRLPLCQPEAAHKQAAATSDNDRRRWRQRIHFFSLEAVARTMFVVPVELRFLRRSLPSLHVVAS